MDQSQEKRTDKSIVTMNINSNYVDIDNLDNHMQEKQK